MGRIGTRTDIAQLADFVRFAELGDLDEGLRALFRRKFRLEAPEFPHHFLASVRLGDGSWQPASYMHATDCGDLVIGGGACTDERVLRRLDGEQRRRLRAFGGIYRALVLYEMAWFREKLPAAFACVGNPVAVRLLATLGFEPAGPDTLFVRWLQAVDAARQRQLVAKAASFMPF